MTIKVGFLFDRDNPWIYEYFKDLRWLTKISENYSCEEIWDLDFHDSFNILFILGNTRIIPLEKLQNNCINLVIHESDLPKGRGFSPVQWQVEQGSNVIKTKLIAAEEEADVGDVFLTDEICLEGHELFSEIRLKQALSSIRLIERFLSAYPSVSATPQSGSPTYYRRRTRKDDELNVDQTLREQFNKLRVAQNDNFPLYFLLNGYKYEILVKKSGDGNGFF